MNSRFPLLCSLRDEQIPPLRQEPQMEKIVYLAPLQTIHSVGMKQGPIDRSVTGQVTACLLCCKPQRISNKTRLITRHVVLSGLLLSSNVVL